uniref:Uncharacterized protein n=1 Tax=Plectus sambesii TaxID=2011161 RepID=A0A914V593_9BILA
YVYAEAAAYILFFLQFPLTALYVHFLAWDMRTIRSKMQSPGRKHSVLTLASAAGHDQGIRCRLRSRILSYEQEHSHGQEKSLLQVPDGTMF